MIKKDLYSTVKTIIANNFNLEENKISLETSSDDIEEWDSLGHIQLILKIESFFKIRFSTVDIPKLTSIEVIVTAIKKYEQPI